jgi:hypothetical protein
VCVCLCVCVCVCVCVYKMLAAPAWGLLLLAVFLTVSNRHDRAVRLVPANSGPYATRDTHTQTRIQLTYCLILALFLSFFFAFSLITLSSLSSLSSLSLSFSLSLNSLSHHSLSTLSRTHSLLHACDAHRGNHTVHNHAQCLQDTHSSNKSFFSIEV